jgi:leucyl-tRNA synthetase
MSASQVAAAQCARPAPAGGGDYDPASIEARWRSEWARRRAFATPSSQDAREPAFVLVPGPVGAPQAQMGRIRGCTIADAYARFLRARGRAVLFSAGCEHAHGQLEQLGCSCDWQRGFASPEPEHCHWAQRLFLLLLEHDLVYRRHARWFMRVGRYAQESDRDLEGLAGWGTAAIGSQHSVLGRVDGVELDAATFDGGGLKVFTAHPEAIPQAEFIAISPAHPDAERWSSESHLATVPGVDRLLPIVISRFVDSRYGPTAVLGIPEVDAADRSIAEQLPALPGAKWKTSRSEATPRPAVRYRAACDVPISRPRGSGTPIPMVHCAACGAVPVAPDGLLVRLPEDLEIAGEDENPLARHRDFAECPCPECHGPAKRETDTIAPRFEEAWMWLALCAPPADRAAGGFSHGEQDRWLPAEQIVFGADEAGRVFDERLAAKALHDLELPQLPGREPFTKGLVHATVDFEGHHAGNGSGASIDPDALVGDVGADALRLVLLYAASPERALHWNVGAVRYCRSFLERLYDYAEPRLRGWGLAVGGHAQIDTDERLRRRLANWCGVARRKATGHLERLEMHRAANETIRLLARIQDFERRTLERRHGELDDEDREAIAAALLILVQLLAPLTPHIAEELWSLSGNDRLVSHASWPEAPRRLAGLGAAAANGGDA